MSSGKPAYDKRPPCSSRAVDTLLRMGLAGFSWGMFMGSYDAGLLGHAGRSKFVFVAKSVARNTVKWGGFGGMYASLTCGFELWRMKCDWKNAMLAGALTGAMAGSLRTGTGTATMAKNAAVVSAICSAVEMMKPTEHHPPPTGR